MQPWCKSVARIIYTISRFFVLCILRRRCRSNVRFAGPSHADIAKLEPEVPTFSEIWSPTVLELPVMRVAAPLLVSRCRIVNAVTNQDYRMVDTGGRAVDDAAFVPTKVPCSDGHAQRAVLQGRKNLRFVVRKAGDAGYVSSSVIANFF